MKRAHLHLVTDDVVLAEPGFTGRARGVMAVAGDRVAVHVRGHRTAARRLYDVAQELRESMPTTGGSLFVNDRIDVALAVGVTGVQLGIRSVPVERVRALLAAAVIGYSAHGAAEVSRARRAGANFVMAGPVFRSASHVDRAPAGVGLVAAAAAEDIDVIAIGGITPDRVADVVRAGATGVAVVSGVWHSQQADHAVQTYLDALESAGLGNGRS